MTVFEAFRSEPIEFLEISRGGVYGNRITNIRSITGVVKRRSNLSQGSTSELINTNTTVHIRPEDVAEYNTETLIGNGLVIDGENFTITNATEGRNFISDSVEHITLTVQPATLVEDEE